MTGIQEVLVLGLVHDGVLETLPLVVVDEDVPHDGVQPALDVGPLLEVVLVAKGLDEGFLDEVIGVLAIPGEAHGKSREEILVARQQVVEFNRRHLVQRSDPKIRQTLADSKVLFNFYSSSMNKTA